MRKRKSSIACLILCLLITLTLVAGLLPGLVKPVLADESGSDEISLLEVTNSILGAESIEPEQLDKYPDDVYGKGDHPFMLSRQDELAMVISTNSPWISEAPPDNKAVTILDTLELDSYEMDDTDAYLHGVSLSNTVNGTTVYSGTANPTKDWHCVQSIGVDADGTGRKQYIVSVGFHESNLKISVQNAVTGDEPYFTTIRDCSQVMSSSYYWARDNYIAITAGDYDGDGKESVVVYVCGNSDSNNDKVELMEFYHSGKYWASRTILKLSSVLKDKTYLNNTDIKYKPAVSLATGDFNGDGRDQLAYSAGFFNTSGSKTKGFENYTCSDLGMFSTCVGIGSCTGSSWSFGNPLWMVDKGSLKTTSGTQRTYEMSFMHAGAIAAGDVDNNGIDEIVVAGYTDHSSSEDDSNYAEAVFNYNNGTETLQKVSNVCDFSENNFICSVVYYDSGTYKRMPMQTIAMSDVQQSTFEKNCNDIDWIFVRPALACGKTNGDKNPEAVFICGVLYDFSSKVPKTQYTPAFLQDETLKMMTMNSGELTSVNWIRNVAVGNFNGNPAGREQFVFTFWQKQKDKDWYYAEIGVIAGGIYEDTFGADNNIIKYANTPKYMANSFNTSQAFLGSYQDIGAAYRCELKDAGDHIVPVAVDTDDDGVLGRFAQSGYVYTDPEVLAVLEASPFFGEIKEAGGYSGTGSTTYTISNAYGTASSKTDSTSFEVGFAGEIQGGSVKVALETGYSMDWSHTYEKSYTLTKGISVSAQSEDVVVIQRIPVLIYTYDIYDQKTKQWIDNGMEVKVPLEPVIYSLSVDAYNRFVDEYNSILDPDLVSQGIQYELIKITDNDLPAGHVGNPDKYWNSWPNAGNGAKQLSTSYSNSDHVDSSITFFYSKEVQSSETTEMGHGFHFGLTVQGGADIGPAGEFWAGGYTNLDYSHSTGYSTTKINTEEAAGTVNGITVKDVAGLTTDEVESGYIFNWSFGKWTRRLDTRQPALDVQMLGDIIGQILVEDLEVPFYGYVVPSVVRRALPPVIPAGKDTKKEGYAAFAASGFPSNLDSDLTVTRQSGDAKISYDSSKKKIMVAAGLKKGTYKATFRISNGLTARDTTFQYTLTVTEGDNSGSGGNNGGGGSGDSGGSGGSGGGSGDSGGSGGSGGGSGGSGGSGGGSGGSGSSGGSGGSSGSGGGAQVSGFPDVTTDSVNKTSYKAIYWAVDNGIVKGYADGLFKPEVICTREQFSIMLWRFAGEPNASVSAINRFSDAGDFANGARKAVAWAVEQGIVAGFSDGSFQPKADITRAQVAVMLWRYAGKPSVSGSSKFSDIGSFGSGVQNAIIWLEGNKIASGYNDGTFQPNGGCQRQHMAIFLYRYSNNIK